MVLQDVNESAPESFSDNPSPDQNDIYASPSSGPRFDPADFPQPLPYGIAIFSTKDQVRRTAEETLKFAERRLGRKLEYPESQALAYHIYQLEQTKSYFALTGSGLGLWRAYATMATNRYPFYQPPPGSINPNKFAFVNGSLAPILRHTWRFSLYYVFGLQMGLVLGQLIAQPLAAQRTAVDPKLEHFANDLKSSAANVRSAAMEQREAREHRREVERQVKDRNGMGPAPQASWGRQPAPAKGRDDDMSPTAGNEAWGSQPSTSGSWDAFSSQGAQDQSSTSQAWNRQGTSSNSSDYDDASPTGGLFQDEVRTSNDASKQAEQTQGQLRPGESAWDRLRRGGTPIPAQRPPPQQSRQRAEPERKEQRDGSTLGDSFTFVEGEEERKKERERAQAEFDARIERERQGKDFNSDEGKRW